MPVSPRDSLKKEAHRSTRRDVTILIAFAAAVGYLAGHFELNERIYDFTRQWERYQLDEWPLVAFALTAGLVWFSRRRYLLASRALQARERAEAHLAEVLKENRQLAQQHLRMQEAAEKHLARELHDELGQYTNAIKLDAIAIQQNPDRHPATSAAATARILAAVDHMHSVVSEIIRRLRPAGLDELGLAAALDHCVVHWQQRMPDTVISLKLDGDFDHLGELKTLTVYRLVQEGLTNAFRHAAAKRIEIRLQREHRADSGADRLLVTIRDDGCRASAPKQGQGFGLSGMRERVEMLAGAFRVESAPQQGFAVTAELPVEDGE